MIKQILTKSLLAAVVLTLASTTIKTFAQAAPANFSHYVRPTGDPVPAPDPTPGGN